MAGRGSVWEVVGGAPADRSLDALVALDVLPVVVDVVALRLAPALRRAAARQLGVTVRMPDECPAGLAAGAAEPHWLFGARDRYGGTIDNADE